MRPPRTKPKWMALLILAAIVFAVSALGSAVTLPKIPGWYASLTKPPFNPPPWVFGPVWTVLYAMMAVAAWRVWLRAPSPGRRGALASFAVQLALNAGWSQVFFGMERPDVAFGVIAALWIALAVTVFLFFRIDRFAGCLLAPYLGWVTFAGVLNGAIVRLN